MYQFPTVAPLPMQQHAVKSHQDAKEMQLGLKVEGHGPAVVLLHSSMGSKSQWRMLMESMRGTHRLIAIDLYGYGDSAMPALGERHSLDDEVRLVQSKLDQLLAPGERFHLVGHSFGGGVALRLAHANPARLHSLALFEPTAFHLLDRKDKVLDDIRAVAHLTRVAADEDQRLAATEIFIDYWSGKGAFAALPPARQALFTSLLPKVPLDFQALIDDPLRPSDYSRMAVPSCLITGRDSPRCTHAIVNVLVARMAKAERHEIGAGHMAPVSHPALVNPIIEGFIRRIDGQASRAQ
ncbi:alpha/beta fold hydrolase [Noviherbaspirillum sp. ST9]|uniref:alpha/beta fold hydrolase n=1 Tax=Noviherbaspirillum sp. ST9 TaxID=3401606 RepID=UPI003B58991E